MTNTEPAPLSISQKAFWEQRLQDAEHAVTVALHMLGRLPLEQSRQGGDVNPTITSEPQDVR